MAAIAYPDLQPSHGRRPDLRVLAPVEVVLRRSEQAGRAAVYRRRRVVAAVVVLAVVLGAALTAGAVVGRVTAPAPVPASSVAESAPRIRVVQPGDTYWSIATAEVAGSEVDVRERVDALIRANGGAVGLRVGDRIVLP